MRALAFALGLLVLAPTLAHAEEEAPTRMKNKSLFVTGMVVGSSGLAAMTTGGVLMLVDAIIPKPVYAVQCVVNAVCSNARGGPSDVMVAGAIALGIGATATLVSLPMLVIGARRVPIEIEPSGPYGSTGMTLRMTF